MLLPKGPYLVKILDVKTNTASLDYTEKTIENVLRSGAVGAPIQQTNAEILNNDKPIPSSRTIVDYPVIEAVDNTHVQRAKDLDDCMIGQHTSAQSCEQDRNGSSNVDELPGTAKATTTAPNGNSERNWDVLPTCFQGRGHGRPNSGDQVWRLLYRHNLVAQEEP